MAPNSKRREVRVYIPEDTVAIKMTFMAFHADPQYGSTFSISTFTAPMESGQDEVHMEYDPSPNHGFSDFRAINSTTHGHTP